MANYSVEIFERHVNQTCNLHLPDGRSLTAELVDVRRLHPSQHLKSEQFAVTWRGPAEPLLQQRIYLMELPDGQRHELFLVPVGRDGAGVIYEAVFT